MADVFKGCYFDFVSVQRGSLGPKGQERKHSPAQDLPWVSQKNVSSPNKEDYGITCDVDLVKPARLSGPYRAKRLFMFTQAKAWAEFSWPFGPSASPLGDPEHLGDSAVRRAMRA